MCTFIVRVCAFISHFLNEPIRSSLFMTAPSTSPKKRFVCGKHIMPHFITILIMNGFMYSSCDPTVHMQYLRSVFRDQDEAIVVYEIAFNVLIWARKVDNSVKYMIRQSSLITTNLQWTFHSAFSVTFWNVFSGQMQRDSKIICIL